ncbi:spore coat U domain-containing protein [Roseomonas sp. 18066]|uniref:Csu type fimbrial protein n=1 Tax=Roseomonas sp. 18066 TaxID=2681412 RepID=UPI00190F4B72|nr:spore coat U domain-containing protein [Roseomonas sp. 18066]
MPLKFCLPVAGLLLLPAAAQAACTLAATPLAFGNYSPRAAATTTSVGTISLTCVALIGLNLSYSIRLSAGGGGSYAARRMASGASHLAYQLFRDSAGASIWGDGTGGTAVVSGTETLFLLGSGRSFSVYGRIPAGQNVAPGSYTDTVQVTVTY